MAKKAELLEAFGTADEQEILLEILAKGELQVGKQEREQAQEATLREIARWGRASACAPPRPGRPTHPRPLAALSPTSASTRTSSGRTRWRRLSA